MNCKPILFNTEMVKAILAGHKTQTRRVAFQNENLRPFRIRDYPEGWWFLGRVYKSFEGFLDDPQRPKCKYKKDNILWVRETWSKDANRYLYRADYSENERFYMNGREIPMRWYPSIHMPKEAARIFLRVKHVWVEHLQDISVENCVAEGIWDDYKASSEKHHENLKQVAYPKAFSELWDSTIKKDDLLAYGWNANPWVWVIEFERCEKPEGWN